MTSFFKDFLIGLLGAVAVVVLALFIVSLSACATVPDYINASLEVRAA